jgi:HKD family nuclease
VKIITDASEINKTLVQLIKKYKYYYIATAWASLGSKASEELLKNTIKIKKMIVGTHFYQTHPDFMENFIDSKKVRFILKPDGIYHPKMYLFVNNKNDWECLIGSANFTMSALTRNDEIMAHIESSDSNLNNAYLSMIEVIDKYWDNSESITSDDFHNYKNIWTKNKKKIDDLSDKYGKSRNTKPLVKSNIFSLKWNEYYQLIQNDDFHSFPGRIDLLNTSKNYFKNHNHFSDMSQINRREIAGIATKKQRSSNIDWGWFGSMIGAGRFQNRINENNNFISEALDLIPLEGKIYKSDYNNFVSLFQKAFPDGGSGIAIGSRLLTMKRPDYFVCLDKQNRPKLCEEFGIAQNISFDDYWDEIIERILNSVWWSSERPDDPIEIQAWQGRSAMLDAIFYEERIA